MSKQRNALRAGIFILFAIAMVFVVVVATQRGVGLFEPLQFRTIVFSLKDDIGGLRIGDDVRIGGYKVGVVRDIQIATQTVSSATQPAAPGIVVTFSMPKKYDLHTDAVVSIQGTVTGQSWLNFEGLGQGPLLSSDDQLKGLPSALSVAFAVLRDAAPKIDRTLANVEQITADARTQTLPLVNRTITKAGETADTFTQTGQAATALVNDLEGHLKPIVNAYYAVADSAIRALTEIGDLFGSSKSDFRDTVANLKSATATVSGKLPDWAKRIDEVLGGLSSAITDANAAIKDIKSTMATANEVIAGNKGKLEGMIKHLDGAATNLELFTAEISARPWRLLYSPKSSEVENLVLFNAAREFAQGASELNDAARALRDASNSPHTDPEKIEKAKEQLNKAFEGFKTVEQKLWDQVRKR